MTAHYARDEQVRHLLGGGLSAKQIAERLDAAPQSIHAVIKRLGLPPRPRPADRWPDLKARYLAECERLHLRPQTTLAKEMGVSKQRAEQIINHDLSPGNAIPVVERFLDAARLFKPKPQKVPRRVLMAEQRARRAAIAARAPTLIATVAAMTRGWGRRATAAREMGILPQNLCNIFHGRTPCGPVQVARLAAWVERHQS